MKTHIINKTEQSFELKEGNAGAYRFLKQLNAGAKFSIKVDPNATYREYMVATGKKGETVFLTSDDFSEYEVIEIQEVPGEDPGTMILKSVPSNPRPGSSRASEKSNVGGAGGKSKTEGVSNVRDGSVPALSPAAGVGSDPPASSAAAVGSVPAVSPAAAVGSDPPVSSAAAVGSVPAVSSAAGVGSDPPASSAAAVGSVPAVPSSAGDGSILPASSAAGVGPVSTASSSAGAGSDPPASSVASGKPAFGISDKNERVPWYKKLKSRFKST